MAYSLSFAPGFFCEGAPGAIPTSDRPTSVYQAILSIQADEWLRIARDVFNADPDRLDPWQVLDRIRITNTCSNLDSPVHVWIDEAGFYGVDVYDRRTQE